VIVYPVAINSADPTNSNLLTQFHVYPTDGGNGSNDAGLALYDANGNLIQSVDQDLNAAAPDDETLSAHLLNDQPYYLAAYFGSQITGPSGPQVDYTLDTTLPTQNQGTVINVDPSTGSATAVENTPGNAFNGSADVHYYALNLLNEGIGGTVTVSPTGQGVAVAATLFQRDSDADDWVADGAVNMGAGLNAVLSIPADAGRSLTDSQYMLAVAPAGFTGAAGSYQISIGGATLLSPSSIDVSTTPPLGTAAPVDLGIAGTTRHDSLTLSETSARYLFLSPAAGPTTVSLRTSAFDSVVSIYSADGSTLLAVGSDSRGLGASTTFTAAANTTYAVRVGSVDGTGVGGFSITVSTPYTPISLALNGVGATTNVSNIAVATGLPPVYYQLQNVAGTDVLAVQVTSPATAVTLTLFGPSNGTTSQTVAANQTTVVTFNISQQVTQLVLEVQSAGGTGNVSLNIAQIAVATTIDPSTLVDRKQSAAGTASANLGTTGLGTTAGFAYFASPGTESGAVFTASASNSNAQPIIAEYEMSAGLMKLE
jgi:hypothetical protein